MVWVNAYVSASPLNVLEDCHFFGCLYFFFSFFRDGRFNVPRGSLPLDEQHRLQRHNQISGNNLQQNSLSTHGAVSGLGHRVVPGVNTVGVSGTNRGTPMSRSGFQGIGSPAVPNNVSMLSSGMVGIPNTGNINSGRGASPRNSMVRPPREAVQHMMRVSYLAFICCYGNHKILL